MNSLLVNCSRTAFMSNETWYSNAVDRLKNNRYIASVLILSAVVVGAAHFSGAIGSLWNLIQPWKPLNIISVIPDENNGHGQFSFTLNVSNQNKDGMIITQVRIRSSLRQLTSGTAFGAPLKANADYIIEYDLGLDKKYDLDPPYVLPVSGVGSFGLMVKTKESPPIVGIDGHQILIELYDSQSSGVVIFQDPLLP